MASQLTLILKSTPKKFIKTLIKFLKKKSRPIFDDELDSQGKLIYSVIEDIEYPSKCEIEEDYVFIHWFDIDDYSFKDIEAIVKLPDCNFVLAYEIPDDPMSADSDDEMSYFWVRMEKGICAVSTKTAAKYCEETLIQLFDENQ
ncbi:MAG: hypothetical protein IPK77_11970 [Cellvibrio sp.]|nr:hypothetical protein [Cellvibrio sp.]